MNIYVQYIIAASAIFGALGISFGQFARGRRGASSEIIDFYKKEAESYKEILKTERENHAAELKQSNTDFNKQMHEMTEKFGTLQGQFTAEKEMREKYEAILKDKNPETVEFMKFMSSSTTQIAAVLGKVYDIVKAEQDREIHIDANITRVPLTEENKNGE